MTTSALSNMIDAAAIRINSLSPKKPHPNERPIFWLAKEDLWQKDALLSWEFSLRREETEAPSPLSGQSPLSKTNSPTPRSTWKRKAAERGWDLSQTHCPSKT